MKFLYYSLIPLLLLILAALMACGLSYLILSVTGDVLPLHKLLSKTTQILLLLSLFPLRRYLCLSWTDLGFAPKTVFFKQLGLGVLIGVVTLLPVLLMLYGLEINLPDTEKVWTVAKIGKRLLISLALALIISLLEEPLFRGLLLTGLQRKTNLIAAILISAFYYAILHFLKSSTPIPYQELSVYSGLQLIGEACQNAVDPHILPAFFALWMVGIFLAVVKNQQAHSLGLCMGIHTGWVWQIKLSKEFFNLNPDTKYSYLVSSYDGVVGPLVSTWLLLVLLLYVGWCIYKNRCRNLTG